MYISKRSGMDHTVLPAYTPCLPFLRKRSPDGATSNWGKRHLIAAYYSSVDPEGMKGWVGLNGSISLWLCMICHTARFDCTPLWCNFTMPVFALCQSVSVSLCISASCSQENWNVEIVLYWCRCTYSQNNSVLLSQCSWCRQQWNMHCTWWLQIAFVLAVWPNSSEIKT